MGEMFGVAGQELLEHARHVEGVAARVENCARTGAEVDFGIDTFGIVGQAFAAFLRPFSHRLASNLTQAAASVRDVSEGLGATAQTYRAVEEHNTGMFGGEGGG